MKIKKRLQARKLLTLAVNDRIMMLCCGAFVRFWHKVDKAAAPEFVRFWTIADKDRFWPAMVCPLLTQSGHSTQRHHRPQTHIKDKI
jgi:hypothetical protein